MHRIAIGQNRTEPDWLIDMRRTQDIKTGHQRAGKCRHRINSQSKARSNEKHCFAVAASATRSIDLIWDERFHLALHMLISADLPIMHEKMLIKAERMAIGHRYATG